MYFSSMKNAKKKAAIYARVSTDRQECTRQVNDLKEYAKRNDLEVVEVFIDITSGETQAQSRKSAKIMFDYLRQERIAVLLLSELARFGRNAIDVQNNIHTVVHELGLDMHIHQLGLKARDRDGNINPVFKIVTDVMANIAQIERERISASVKSGLREAKRKGKVLGRPKGFSIQGEALLARYPKVCRELRQGLSLRKIAKLCDVSVNTVRKVKAAMPNG